MARTADPVQLRFQTLDEFNSHIRKAETEMEQTLHGEGSFLWSEANSKRVEQRLKGEIPAEFWSGKNPVEVPDGLIHDWIGAVGFQAQPWMTFSPLSRITTTIRTSTSLR